MKGRGEFMSDKNSTASEMELDLMDELNIESDADFALENELLDDANTAVDEDDSYSQREFNRAMSSEVLFQKSLLNAAYYTAEEEKDAFSRLRAAKEANDVALYKNILDEISLHNMRLVAKVASKYAPMTKSLSFEDLVIAGYMGLRNAIEKFEVDKGFKFSTYAIHWIKQGVGREIMNVDDVIKIPVHAQEKLYSYNIANDEEKERMFRNNSNVRDAILATQITSLDIKVESDSSHDDESCLGDFMASNVDIEGDVLEKAKNEAVRRVLDESIEKYAKRCRSIDEDRLRDIVYSRFGFNDGTIYTLQDLGDKYGCTRERIRQIERDYLKFLRHSHYARELAEYADADQAVHLTHSAAEQIESERKQASRDLEYREALKKAGFEYIKLPDQEEVYSIHFDKEDDVEIEDEMFDFTEEEIE